MRALFFVITWFIFGFALIQQSWGADVSLTCSAATPGGVSACSMVLTSDSVEIGGVADDISFDESLLTPTGCTSDVANISSLVALGIKECSNAGAPNTATACNSDADCAAPYICDVYRVIVTNIPIKPIPDGPVATCSFAISEAAKRGDALSLPSNPSTADVDSNWVTTTDPPATIAIETRRQQDTACMVQLRAARKIAATAYKACRAE